MRVPRPVNEPGKGSYWTVDQYAAENEHNVRSTVRGRQGRSSSDSSLHRTNNDPWLYRNSGRYYRDGRSLSNDADSAAARRTSQYGYCSHPYGNYDRSYPYGYYHYPQRMPSHETLLSARQHSSVTYSLPASANQQTPFNSFSNSNNMYSMQQSPFYSHRQSCPDLTSATYSETNMLSNFNNASSASNGEVCFESDNKPLYDIEKSEQVFTTKKENLPSPVLSSSTSPSSSSQHLSVADPLTMVAQHHSPVMRTAPGNRMTSPYSNSMNNNGLASKEEESPSSPLNMNGKTTAILF